MTTTSRTSSNKTALRASLKKEDDSLADRLVGADAPIEATNHSDVSEPDLPTSAAVTATVTATPSAPARRAAAGPAAAAKAPAARRPATPRKTPVQAAPAAEPAVAPKARSASRKVAAAGPKAKAATSMGTTVETLDKVVKQKRDKLVSYSVKLLKSEEAAIEALRDELSRVAGWAATKSDILRAGVQVFATQKLEQMQALLGSLSAPVDGKKVKKDKKKKKR